MSDGAVVDASVAIKRLIEEPQSRQAESLFDDMSAAQSPLLGPPHLPGEVLNGLYRRTRRAENEPLTEPQATAAAERFLSLPLQILSPTGLYQQAFHFATSQRLDSVYDSIYVTLAKLLDVELWTADVRLLQALRGEAPWVRWIGDYP